MTSLSNDVIQELSASGQLGQVALPAQDAIIIYDQFKDFNLVNLRNQLPVVYDNTNYPLVQPRQNMLFNSFPQVANNTPNFQTFRLPNPIVYPIGDRMPQIQSLGVLTPQLVQVAPTSPMTSPTVPIDTASTSGLSPRRASTGNKMTDDYLRTMKINLQSENVEARISSQALTGLHASVLETEAKSSSQTLVTRSTFTKPHASQESGKTRQEMPCEQETDSTRADSIKDEKVINVPYGWRREIEKDAVFYVSPSQVRLYSLSELHTYFSTDGTCKCGLECPLRVEEVFSFDHTVRSETCSLDSINQDFSKLCNHRRKILAMATYESSRPTQPESKESKKGDQKKKKRCRSAPVPPDDGLISRILTQRQKTNSDPSLDSTQKSAGLSIEFLMQQTKALQQHIREVEDTSVKKTNNEEQSSPRARKFDKKPVAKDASMTKSERTEGMTSQFVTSSISDVIGASSLSVQSLSLESMRNPYQSITAELDPPRKKRKRTPKKSSPQEPNKPSTFQDQSPKPIPCLNATPTPLLSPSATGSLLSPVASSALVSDTTLPGQCATDLLVNQPPVLSNQTVPTLDTGLLQVDTHYNALVTNMQIQPNSNYLHSDLTNDHNLGALQQRLLQLQQEILAQLQKSQQAGTELPQLPMQQIQQLQQLSQQLQLQHGQYNQGLISPVMPQLSPMPPISVPPVTSVSESMTPVIPTVPQMMTQQPIVQVVNPMGLISNSVVLPNALMSPDAVINQPIILDNVPNVYQALPLNTETDILGLNQTLLMQKPVSQYDITQLSPEEKSPVKRSKKSTSTIATMLQAQRSPKNYGMASSDSGTGTLDGRSSVSSSGEMNTSREDFESTPQPITVSVDSQTDNLDSDTDCETYTTELNSSHSSTQSCQTDEGHDDLPKLPIKVKIHKTERGFSSTIVTSSNALNAVNSSPVSSRASMECKITEDNKLKIFKKALHRSLSPKSELQQRLNTISANLSWLKGDVENRVPSKRPQILSRMLREDSDSEMKCKSQCSDSGSETEVAISRSDYEQGHSSSDSSFEMRQKCNNNSLKDCMPGKVRDLVGNYIDRDDIDNRSRTSPDSPLPSFPRNFDIGDLVWGQIRGFPSWPGKLIDESAVKGNHHKTEDGKLWVRWFGDHTCTQVEPDKLKTLSEGLEAHHRARKKHRKGRKMNCNLEAAIQEAMAELDKQTVQEHATPGEKTSRKHRS